MQEELNGTGMSLVQDGERACVYRRSGGAKGMCGFFCARQCVTDFVGAALVSHAVLQYNLKLEPGAGT